MSLGRIEGKYKAASKDTVEHSKVGAEMLSVLERFQEIEAKEKCIRVQFLDWLSDKLLDWSNQVHTMASNINSPCLIEVAPRKKEESRSAKEAKEIARLKEALVIKNQANEKLHKAMDELAKDYLTVLKKELAE